MRRMMLPLLPLALAACQPAAVELTDQEKAAIAAEVDSVTAEWWDAWKAADLERGLSFMADEPVLVWVGAGPTIYSLAQAREQWAPMLVGLGRQEIEFTDQRTIVLARDVVWTLHEMTWTALDTAGAVLGEGRGNETAVWVKRNGEWKVMLGHDDEVPEET